jgi:leucyl-tRNA synthetase
MRDLGLVKVDEPFTRLLTQGMVLNHIYSRKGEKGGIEYFWPHEVQDQHDASGKVVGAVLKQAKGELPAGTPIVYEGVGTMSKSKNNGVDPQDLIEKYGADTARLYTMFTAPPEATLEWNDAAVEGSYRFLRRVWNFGVRLAALPDGPLEMAHLGSAAKALRCDLHTVLKQVDYDYQRMQYNTVVSGAMKMLNALEDFKPDPAQAEAAAVLREGFGILLRCLYPATPHIAWALWRKLGFESVHGPLLDAPWPQVDPHALEQDEIELVLQINGKLRGSLRVPATADRAQIEAAGWSTWWSQAHETPPFHAFGARAGRLGRLRLCPAQATAVSLQLALSSVAAGQFPGGRDHPRLEVQSATAGVGCRQ